MSKKMYSPELKLEIIQRYLEKGESVTSLAREYYIGSRADIRKWIAQYNEHGIARLSTTHGTYTSEFKVSVVEYMHTTEASIRATAAHFGIPSPTVCLTFGGRITLHGGGWLFLWGEAVPIQRVETERNSKRTVDGIIQN